MNTTRIDVCDTSVTLEELICTDGGGGRSDYIELSKDGN